LVGADGEEASLAGAGATTGSDRASLEDVATGIWKPKLGIEGYLLRQCQLK
jgi:hypothetical protein